MWRYMTMCTDIGDVWWYMVIYGNMLWDMAIYTDGNVHRYIPRTGHIPIPIYDDRSLAIYTTDVWWYMLMFGGSIYQYMLIFCRYADIWRYIPIHRRYMAIYTTSIWRYKPRYGDICRHTGLSANMPIFGDICQYTVDMAYWYIPKHGIYADICRYADIWRYTPIHLSIHGDRYWYILICGEIPIYGDTDRYVAMYANIPIYAEIWRWRCIPIFTERWWYIVIYGIYGNICQCTGKHSVVWCISIYRDMPKKCDMVICGNVWGDIWQYIATYANVRWYVTIYGDIWWYLGACMAICRYMAIHGDMAVYGDVNRHRLIMATYADMPIYAVIRMLIYGSVRRYIAIYTDIWRDIPSRLTQNLFQGPLQALAIWLLELHFARAGSRKAHFNPSINILMFRVTRCASGLT